VPPADHRRRSDTPASLSLSLSLSLCFPVSGERAATHAAPAVVTHSDVARRRRQWFQKFASGDVTNTCSGANKQFSYTNTDFVDLTQVDAKMYSDVDDVRDADDKNQLNAGCDDEPTDNAGTAQLRVVSDSSSPAADDGGRDLTSKPTAVCTAPLSSRASAFSIAALMKDRDTHSASPALRGSEQHRHCGDVSLYDVATDHWQRQDSDIYSARGETVQAQSDAKYWTTCSSSGQCRTYLR